MPGHVWLMLDIMVLRAHTYTLYMTRAHEFAEQQYAQADYMDNPKARKLRRVLQAATWWNAVAGVVLAGVGINQHVPAAATDGIHSVTDTLSHAGHVKTHQEEQRQADPERTHNPTRVRLARRVTAVLIGAGALFSAWQTGEAIRDRGELAVNWFALAGEATSAAASGTLMLATRKYHDGSLAATDAERHLGTDAIISGAAAGAIALSGDIDWAQPLVAAGATVLTARLAYQTWVHNPEHFAGAKGTATQDPA